MKKLLIKLGLLMALPFTALQTFAAVPFYDMEAAKANAQADFANWMKYLPDDVFVAHVSIPGTHDTATAEGWESSTGPTMSTTQEVNIDGQLTGGIRAFDFRPGMVNNELWCNHGSDRTKLKLADAFRKLKNYLTEHPSEFFVMHVYRGNIYRAGEGNSIQLTAGLIKNDASSQAKYNTLINEMFNQGEFSDMFIEYSPYLKVGDVRGHIIVFRRDRIDFAHIYKAGNLVGWDDPACNEWDENKKVSVILDGDGTVTGTMYATDISSPDNDSELEMELRSMENLYNYNCNQTLPNDAKRNGSYKPDWSMIFTSGALYNENTEGYKKNAAKTNPHFTWILNEAEKNGTAGPTGIVLSDWVLTNNYSAQGVDLVPAIIYNNFEYIDKYILDDELFAKAEFEKYWEEGKEYFLRNVGTGEFLNAGATWGTRGSIIKDAKEGLAFRFKYDDNDGTCNIFSSLGNGNGIGYDGSGYYMDFGGLEKFEVHRLEGGKFNFQVTEWKRDDVKTQALGVIPISEDWVTNWSEDYVLQYQDGTTHVANAIDFDLDDPMQQWEVIGVDEYYNEIADRASKKLPVDVSLRVKGHKVIPNDINNWTGTTNYNKPFIGNVIQSYINYTGIDTKQNKNFLIQFTHTTYSTNTQKQYTAWSMNHSIPIEREGMYKLRFKTGYNAINTSNSEFVYNVIAKSNSSTLSTENIKTNPKFISTNTHTASEVISKFNGTDKDKYTVEIDYTFDQPGEIVFDISYKGGKTITSVFLDDVELIYYGPDPTKRYVVLVRAMADAKRRLADMGKTMDFSEYEEGMLSNAYSGQGEEPALEIYKKLRDLTYEQTPDDSNSHQDYTNAIINAGFETGTMMGWETSYEGDHDVDTGVRPATGDYAMSTNHNDFLFNAAQTDPDPENKARGVILSQKIPNLPAGHYILTAEASNDPGNCIYITVNDQKSEAKVLSGNDKTGEMITFGFEVAENTEEVTISFMGGNSDGSFDEFGGNWYKLDDIHLYRTGAADLCVFFNRLSEAINRSDVIARKTMPEYYQKLWKTEDYRTTIDNMIKEHLASGHKDGDLDGSNGLAERTELFNHLSKIVLSQAETKANMSGAIRNNSFELGDLSYWNTLASPIATNLVTNGKYKDGTPMEDFYQVEGKVENYIYFSKLPADPDNLAGNGESYPIYQSISGLPAGQYELSVWIASTPGNKFYLAANGVSKEITAKSDIKFQNEIVTFTIEEDGSDLLLGLYPSADGTFVGQESQALIKGPWFAVDDFELHLVGRQVSIDWVMETPTHGTIILPFDHEVPAKLEIYSLKEHTDPLAQVATHKILVYEKQDKINANTPYVVKRADAGEMPAAKSVGVKAASADDADLASRTYHFSGFTTNENMAYDDDEYKNGVLTGVLVPTEVEGSQYHLQSYEDNVGFVLHEEGPDHDALEPYHAYITLSEDTEQPETIHGLYFEEPSLPLEWMMEGDYYGTIILPFDAELPAEKDMKAYKLTIGDEAKEFGINAEGQYRKYTYQMIALDEGTTDLKANTPYLVIKNDAFVADEEETEPLNFMNLRLKPLAEEADDDEEDPRMVTFKGVSAFDNNEFSDGVMTGVHQDSSVDASDKNIYTLVQDGKTGMFISNDLGNSSDIAKNHAYIRTTSESPVHFLMLTEPQSENDPNDVETGIDEILAANANVDVYTTGGILLSRDVPAAEALAKLAPGIYILRSGKLTVKVIK